MHWLLHVLGVDNVSGQWYGFWSGFGSDIGELAIAGSLIDLARRGMRRHREKLAQADLHHRETLAQAQQHHDEAKAHLAQHLAAHCADLKDHMQAAQERIVAPPAAGRRAPGRM